DRQVVRARRKIARRNFLDSRPRGRAHRLSLRPRNGNQRAMTTVPVGVEGLLRDLLIDANSGVFALPQPSFASLAEGVWGEYSLAGWKGRLSSGKDGLALFIKAEWEDMHILTAMMHTRNQPASIVLADESLIEAELAHMTRIRDEAEIQLYHWSWRTAAEPACWVGELVAELPRLGNMRVNERGPDWS